MSSIEIIKKIALSKILGKIYDATCSQLRVFYSKKNFDSAVFSKSKLKKLYKLEGVRIFTSNIKYTTKPPICSNKYLGNWAILINSNNELITVCGFFECAPLTEHEFFVTHVSLCKFIKSKYPDYKYLFSGSFKYSNTFNIDVRSGTWAIAKNILQKLNYIPKENINIDNDVVKFAKPLVKKLILHII